MHQAELIIKQRNWRLWRLNRSLGKSPWLGPIFRSKVRIFRSKIPASDSKVRIFKLKLGTFGSKVGTFKSKLGIFDPKVGTFKLKLRIFDSKVAIFKSKVGCFRASYATFGRAFSTAGCRSRAPPVAGSAIPLRVSSPLKRQTPDHEGERNG